MRQNIASATVHHHKASPIQSVDGYLHLCLNDHQI